MGGVYGGSRTAIQLNIPGAPSAIASALDGYPGALFVHGLTPGPMLMIEQPDMFWLIIGAMVMANVFMLIFGLTGIRPFARIVEMPCLHRLAGQHGGIEVSFEPLVPTDLGLAFEDVLECAHADGYRRLNITCPYKERVVPMVRVDDPVLRAMGAVNRVIFGAIGPSGFYTGFTGFKAAYARVRKDQPPGTTLLIGTGGVGGAIAVGLADLGAGALHLVDRDRTNAEALVADLLGVFPGLALQIGAIAEAVATGVSGIVNATPVGVVGQGCTPRDPTEMAGAKGAFDAVYTPKDTQLLGDAAKQGLDIVSRWELFFQQGLQAWTHFSGEPTDAHWLRAALIGRQT